MRIVHIITRLLRAGSEENTLLTCAGQIAAGHEVYVLHGRDVNRGFALQMAPGVTLREIPALQRELTPSGDPRAFRQIRAALKELRPDVVHTHQSKAGIVGRLAAASVGTPAVIHGVHILPFLEETGWKRSVYLVAERLAGRMTHGFIHVSDGMLSSCLEHRVGAGKVHRVVHSGFDLQRFARAEPAADWRAILGVGEGEAKPPVVAMIASLEERKQHLELLDRIPAILAACPDARFAFAGEGDLKDAIAGRIAATGLAQRVALLGYRTDPERIIAMADLGILCSRREGLPRSVMQYLSGGRPAVVFHTEGIEQLIRDGQNGLILPQGDWDGLVSGIAGLLGDTTRRERMARQARDTDLSPWNAALMAGRTLEVYEDVLGKSDEMSGARPADAA